MKLWHCVGALVMTSTSCKDRGASLDAMVVNEAGPPARLVWVDSAWVYDRDVPKRAMIHIDNTMVKEATSIRMPTGESLRVAAGGVVRLTVPATSFTFDRVHADGRAESMGPFALAEGGAYIYDVDALATYEVKTQAYSNLGLALGGDGSSRRIAGAIFFAVKADFILGPFPDKVPMKSDEAIATRTGIQIAAAGTPTCTQPRNDAGSFASICAVDNEWTIQVRGEGDAPTATVYVDNAYADSIELRVDQVSVATLTSGSLTRVHLSPQSHVLGAYVPHGAPREETTQVLKEWTSYVWTPEKRRSFTVESRDYGASFASPALAAFGSGPRRLNAPGFFETDADFLFVPFPDTVTASGYTVGTTRKRLARIGAPNP